VGWIKFNAESSIRACKLCQLTRPLKGKP
jgi:hypothetical protein